MARTTRAERLAQDQARRDAILAASLDEKRRELATQPPANTPERPTLVSNFHAAADAIAKAKRETRLSEATLIKAWELNMGWALSHRDETPAIPTQTLEGVGEQDDEEEPLDGPPIIHEHITAEAEETE